MGCMKDDKAFKEMNDRFSKHYREGKAQRDKQKGNSKPKKNGK